MLHRSSPIFAVTDVRVTIAFYRDTLGFGREWYWGDPVTFGGIHLGDVHVMFHQQPQIAAHSAGHEHHYWCQQVDDLYEKHRAAGAPIIQAIANMPWDVREYRVRDPDGYELRFSGPTRYEKPPTAASLLPGYVRIDARLPSADEFASLHSAVGWGVARDVPRVLACAFAGVVAIDTRDGATIAALRIVREANVWFSIWDVMVHPEHQSQRVGAAIIDAALSAIRAAVPTGATVHLFATKRAFYERAGFKPEIAMVYRF